MQLPCAGDQRRRPSGKLAACGTSKLNGGRGGASRLEVDDAGEAITSWTSLHVDCNMEIDIQPSGLHSGVTEQDLKKSVEAGTPAAS
uniref:Uncharacterized protein n=1 Tax=Oryza rufipogon TaxID=4529 RepID=A0A0E0RJ70_ORYRU